MNAFHKDSTSLECNPNPKDDNRPEDRILSGKNVPSGYSKRFTLVSDLGLLGHVDTDLVFDSTKTFK
jgi:hypothetical protein